MNFLVIVLLFVVFLQTRIMDLRRAIICLSVQSAVIALACFISGTADNYRKSPFSALCNAAACQ